MKAPAIVSGDGQDALGQRRHRAVADAHLQERRREARLDLVDVEVQLVRAHADQPDVEDEVRVGPLRQRLDEGRLALDRRGVELERSKRVRPTRRSSTVTSACRRASSSSTRSTLPARSWSSATGSGAPEYAYVTVPASALLRRVPVAEREVVEPGWRRSPSAVITTSSRSVLPGIAIEPWTMPIVPRGGGRVAVRDVEARERAVRGALRGEDPAVDDGVEARQVDGRLVRGRGPSRSRRRGAARRAPSGRTRDRSTRGRRRRGCPG